MEIHRETIRGIVLYQVAGRLDSKGASVFGKVLMADIGQGIRQILLDCQMVDYISSAGFVMLLETVDMLRRNGNGKLVMCCLKDYVKEVFEIAGFDMILSIAQSRDDALNCF